MSGFTPSPRTLQMIQNHQETIKSLLKGTTRTEADVRAVSYVRGKIERLRSGTDAVVVFSWRQQWSAFSLPVLQTLDQQVLRWFRERYGVNVALYLDGSQTPLGGETLLSDIPDFSVLHARELSEDGSFPDGVDSSPPASAFDEGSITNTHDPLRSPKEAACSQDNNHYITVSMAAEISKLCYDVQQAKDEIIRIDARVHDIRLDVVELIFIGNGFFHNMAVYAQNKLGPTLKYLHHCYDFPADESIVLGYCATYPRVPHDTIYAGQFSASSEVGRINANDTPASLGIHSANCHDFFILLQPLMGFDFHPEVRIGDYFQHVAKVDKDRVRSRRHLFPRIGVAMPNKALSVLDQSKRRMESTVAWGEEAINRKWSGISLAKGAERYGFGRGCVVVDDDNDEKTR